MRAFDHTILQMLEGWLPRHVFDVEMGETRISPEFGAVAQHLIDRAFSEAVRISDTLESQCHELGCIENEGLAGRVRYLTAIAIVAAVLCRWSDRDVDDRLAFLRAVHAVADRQRPGATYDLSNAMAAQRFPIEGMEFADRVGTWIWLNLAPSDPGVYFRWVASTLRFLRGFGREALEVAAVIASEMAEKHASSNLVREDLNEVPSSGRSGPVARDEARQIAEAYIASHPGRLAGATVSVVRSLEDDGFRRPNAYGVRLEGCWIVYLEGTSVEALKSSEIIVVCKTTGEVVYSGSAHDEG